MAVPVATAPATLAHTIADGTLTLTLAGHLSAETIGDLWTRACDLAEDAPPRMVVDLSAVDYCDGAGVALLVKLRLSQTAGGGRFELEGLSEEHRRLLTPFAEFEPQHGKRPPESLAEEVGIATWRLYDDIRAQISFLGETFAAIAYGLTHFRSLRWKDAFLTAERAGVAAVPIVAMMTFLIGLIMGFQSAVSMRPYGTEIYVPNLVALTILRELGPLITAIILAGRTGSAFAAELGTMKVNEEIDALVTMGLDPVRFLVTTRVLAVVAVTPLLALFANFCGLAGGAVVFLSIGYSLVTYHQQVVSAIDFWDLYGGLLKTVAFGFLIATTGCLQGLKTGSGAAAVGVSTTRSVVSGIFLIILADFVFSLVYYNLGI